LSKNTGAAAASPASTCNVKTKMACLGVRGSHLIAKNAMTGIWPAHQQLPEMCSSPFVGFTARAKEHHVAKDEAEGGE